MSRVANEDVARVYEEQGRSMTATAAALGISAATVRRRLRAFHGRVPKPVLRSSGGALGTKFEHRVRDALESAGWWVVRAAGSKGAADLVGIRGSYGQATQVVLVQAKRGGVVSVSEWNALYELAQALGAAAVVAGVGPNGRGIVWSLMLGPRTPRQRQSARSAPWRGP